MIASFDHAAVTAALPYPALIAALEQAFRREGEALPVRQSYEVGPEGAPAHLLTMPAWERGAAIGVKLVNVFPQNAAKGQGAVSSVYVLFDGTTGAPRALIDGEALTNRRTAAASALASRFLSRADSQTLLLIGTGKLAAHLPEAHRTVRPLRRVLVHGRNPAKAEALVELLRAQGFEAAPVSSLAAGLAEADIVSCATTAREALVLGAQVRPGTHVDLVGAFTPQMRESDDALIARSRVYADTRAGALKEAGDLVQAIAAGAWGAEALCGDLHDLTRGLAPGRQSAEEVTLFKSVGAALEDLAAARLVAGV